MRQVQARRSSSIIRYGLVGAVCRIGLAVVEVTKTSASYHRQTSPFYLYTWRIAQVCNFSDGNELKRSCSRMTLQAIKYSRGKLEILDQLRLPHEKVYIDIGTIQDAWIAIKSMQVRGAPAIALVAALSIAVDVMHLSRDELQAVTAQQFAATINRHLRHLVNSRPTAVNLADAAAKLKAVVDTAANESNTDSRTVMTAYLQTAERMLIDDVQDNERIGKHGADWLLQHTASNSSGSQVSVITHCNTG